MIILSGLYRRVIWGECQRVIFVLEVSFEKKGKKRVIVCGYFRLLKRVFWGMIGFSFEKLKRCLQVVEGESKELEKSVLFVFREFQEEVVEVRGVVEKLIG